METRTPPSTSTRPNRTRPSGGGSPLSTVVRRPGGRQRLRLIASVAVGILGTLVLTLIVLNVSSGEGRIDHKVARLYSVGDAQFVRSMGSLLGPPLVPGNSVVELLNGDRIFPAMLEAIRAARWTITFETYIYWSGRIGEESRSTNINRRCITAR